MKIFTYLLFTIALLSFHDSAFAAEFELVVPFAPVYVGDIIQIPVYVNSPHEDIVIAQANIVFPETMMWAKSFTLAPGWLPVVGGEYHTLDNGHGSLRKTAGFEGGISGRIRFGTFEGILLGAGDAEVSIIDTSFLFGKSNNNVFQKNDRARFLILDAPSHAGLPSALFDIHVELADDTVTSPEPLVARTIFQSFGSIATPVDIFFTVVDSTGKVFAEAQESVVVETETVFTKRFEELNLPVGHYTLRVNTRYKGNVEDEFSAPFTVVSSGRLRWVVGGGAVGVAIVALAVLARIIRKKNYGTTD